jgi:predicted TIM-barrel fold metal-dependent hydrolase
MNSKRESVVEPWHAGPEQVHGARVIRKLPGAACAALAARYPDRFGYFACLPLPDVDGAIEEVLVSLKDGSAQGVVLLTNSRGRYLGDPAFDPLMEELADEGAVAFVHPTPMPGMHHPRFRPALADFLLDTTRAAIGLVTSGTISRFPSIRFILSHGGGFVPYAAHRIAWLTEMFDDRYDDGRGGMSADEMLVGLRTFYFDLALSSSGPQLAALLNFTDARHLLYGSDWPYAGERPVRHFLEEYEGFGDLTTDQRTQIASQTAADLGLV